MALNPGSLNRLTIGRQTDNGLYLHDTEENEVLLPNRYVPESEAEGWAIGAEVDVFVYLDSEDRLVATTDRPKIMVGELAALEVVSTTPIGAFMDWGLPKDLLVPFKNQVVPMKKGERHMVALYVDNTTGRLVGTTKIGKYFSNEELTVAPKQKVSVRLAQRRDRGWRVIVDERHWAMLYDNQIFQPVEVGETYTGWISKIAEDGRIDVALQPSGYNQVQRAAAVVLELLEQNGGELPYGDKTDPEAIAQGTGLSKKVFKRAVGLLLGEKKVETGPNATRLVHEE